MNRQPAFLITDDGYAALGAVSVESGRWVGRDTSGRVIFDRKDMPGAKAAALRLGQFVSSAWYGVSGHVA